MKNGSSQFCAETDHVKLPLKDLRVKLANHPTQKYERPRNLGYIHIVFSNASTAIETAFF